MVYKWYILPIGGLYATYHLLGEPETAIEKGEGFTSDDGMRWKGCVPGDSLWPFYPLVGGHLTPEKVT